MPKQNTKASAVGERQRANASPTEPSRPAARQGDEKRGSSASRLEKYAAKIRPEPVKVPVKDRRRNRLTTSDIDVPHRQTNLNALRFGLRGLDILLVCAIIAIGIWNGYIGVNQRAQ